MDFKKLQMDAVNPIEDNPLVSGQEDISDIFSTPQSSKPQNADEKQIKEIPIENIIPSKHNKFDRYTGEKKEAMIDSIKENGILSPLTLRKTDKPDIYEIISGENRWICAREAGKTTVPAYTLNCSEEDAIMYLTEANLINRDISFRERIIAYRQQYDVMKLKSGERSDLQNEGEKVDSLDKIVCGDCGTKLTRYKSAKENTKKASYAYICPHHTNFPDDCHFLSLSENVLKDIVMQSIRLQIVHLCNMDEMFADVSKSPNVKKKQIELTKAMSDALSNISYIKTGRIRLTADFASGFLNEEEYRMAKSEFDEQLKLETDRLEAVTKSRDKFDKLISAGKWINDMKKYKGSKKLSQEMVDAFIKQIKIYADKCIEIEWTYTEKQSEILSYLEGGAQIA